MSNESSKSPRSLQLEQTQDDLPALRSFELLDDYEEHEAPYCCGRCKHVITEEGYQISIHGRHNHRFMNPVGIVYNVACFEEAPGVITVGHEETNYTWFPGYAWQVVRCSECQLHLGWLYTRETSAFFGLIIDRLHKGHPQEPPPGTPSNTPPDEGLPL